MRTKRFDIKGPLQVTFTRAELRPIQVGNSTLSVDEGMVLGRFVGHQVSARFDGLK